MFSNRTMPALAPIALLFLSLCIGRPNEAATSPVSCFDEDGNKVDWFMAYKFPYIKDAEGNFDSGFAYSYITDRGHGRISQGTNSSFSSQQNDDSHRTTQGRRHSSTSSRNVNKRSTSSNSPRNNNWIVSKKLITDSNSVVMRTLRPAFSVASNQRPSNRDEPASKVNFLFYNDQEPEPNIGTGIQQKQRRNRRNNVAATTSDAARSEKAHAKGVLIVDDITRRGIWLTHSTPQFPPMHNESLKFGDNAKQFGQTFMCVSFDAASYGSHIGQHLLTMAPNVYDHQINDRLGQLVPEFVELTRKRRRSNKSRDDKGSNKSVAKIKTLAGQELTLFSKSAHFDTDMYSALIGSNLNTDLYVESWRNGNGNPLNSSCPKNNKHVNNVEELQVSLSSNDGDQARQRRLKWASSKDHSKWAISEEEKPEIVCISDINRMQSQFKRGGGSVCMKCPTCWSVFSNTIASVEPCKLNRGDSSVPQTNSTTSDHNNNNFRREKKKKQEGNAN